jgi:hypothetical protein
MGRRLAAVAVVVVVDQGGVAADLAVSKKVVDYLHWQCPLSLGL